MYLLLTHAGRIKHRIFGGVPSTCSICWVTIQNVVYLVGIDLNVVNMNVGLVLHHISGSGTVHRYRRAWLPRSFHSSLLILRCRTSWIWLIITWIAVVVLGNNITMEGVLGHWPARLVIVFL